MNLLEKYSTKELAESFVFRTKLTTEQQKEAEKELSEMRKKVHESSGDYAIRCSEFIKADANISEYTIILMFIEYGKKLLNEKK
jgi:hypothetical protein